MSGQARLAGVLGWPVGHSLSPALHGHWLAEHGIDGAYLPLAVAPDDLAEAVRGLVAAGFQGFNVTIPHKQAIVGLLDEIDATARRIGAVNTVVRLPDGRLEGRNTDGHGFLAHLRQSAPAWSAEAGRAVVLGAGGAARAAVAALLDAGVDEIVLVNRTQERAAAVAGDLSLASGSPSTTLRTCPWGNRHDALEKASLLVNTTSLGMSGQPALDIDVARLPPDTVVYDIVYAPFETRLLVDAAARGLAVVGGLGMLLHQAVPGFEAWFGVRPAVTPALTAVMMALLEERRRTQ